MIYNNSYCSVCTGSPFCRSDIVTNIPFSVTTFATAGKQPPGGGGGGSKSNFIVQYFNQKTESLCSFNPILPC